MQKIGQFLADDSCLWSQEVDCTRKPLKQLDDSICAFDNTAMRAVVFKQLETLRLTRSPTPCSNRSLGNRSGHFILAVTGSCKPGIYRQTRQVA